MCLFPSRFVQELEQSSSFDFDEAGDGHAYVQEGVRVARALCDRTPDMVVSVHLSCCIGEESPKILCRRPPGSVFVTAR